MLDEFLKVSYTADRSKEQSIKLSSVMARTLPKETLMKIASGELKFSHLMGCGSNSDAEWLDRFKGTELFEQAMALEQAELDLEAQRLQQQVARRTEDTVYDQEQDIRLKKRMLDLELARHESVAGGAAPEAPPPAAEPPPAEAPPTPPAGPEAKMAFAQKLASEMAAADVLRARFQKTAAGLAGLGQAALGIAKANPSAVAGAALGAGAGAIRGMSDPNRSAGSVAANVLGGGALGTAGGLAAGTGIDVASRMSRSVGKPPTLGGALKSSVNNRIMNTGIAAGVDKKTMGGYLLGAKPMGTVAAPAVAPTSAPGYGSLCSKSSPE